MDPQFITQLKNQLRADFEASLADIRTQLATVQQNVTLNGDIEQLKIKNLALNTALQQHSTASTTTSISTHRPRRVLQTPEKFNGSAYKIGTWLPSVLAVAEVDWFSFQVGDSDDQRKIAIFFFVFLCLESHIQAIVLPQIAVAQKTKVYDYTKITGQIERIYNNPHKATEAEDALHDEHQGSSSFAKFYPVFEGKIYKANGQGWSN